MSWLWGCMVIFFKGCIGSILFSLSMAAIGLLIAGLVTGIAWMFSLNKKEEKLKDWVKEQESELKSLVDEIDKDLK